MAAVLCFLFLLQSFAIRVTLNEVARYEFNQRSGTQVSDSTGTLGPLTFSGNVSWLAESIGIEIGMPGFLECTSFGPIAPSLLANFTLEFWLNYPSRSVGQDMWLVGLGNMTGRDPFTLVPAQSFALFQSGNGFYYNLPNALISVSNAAIPSGLAHWVFSTNFRVVSQNRPGPPVYVNGTYNPGAAGTPPPNYPFPASAPLQIAPITQAGLNWYGKILHFSVYSRLLSASEILQNFQAGPADSAPYASDFNFTGPMDTVLNFSIHAYDLDFAFPAKNETQNCTIHTVPLIGTFLMGGTPVQAGTVVPRDQEFTYLGEVLGWGNRYANLTFSCNDSTGKVSGVATAWINLLHVDHPPTPNNLTINAVRANKTLIVLTGTNLDYYPMGLARITRLPTNGSLYLDTKPTSTLILANATFPVNVTQLNSKGQSQLFYVSDTTSGANAGGQAVLFMDSFGFEISSKPNGSLPNLWSVYPGSVNISVTNNLFSQSTTVTMPESTPDTSNHKGVTFPGTNSLNLTYYAIIQSLPSHGKLYLPGSATPLAQSDLPQIAGTNPATPAVVNLSIEYLPDFYYYGNDSFTFQLNETETGWLSAVATLSFTMTPVNQAPTIVFPNNTNMTFEEDEQKYITVLVYDIDNETSAPYGIDISSILGEDSPVSLNISAVARCADWSIDYSVFITGKNASWACTMASLYNVSMTASFFGATETNGTRTLRVTVTDKAVNSDPFSEQGYKEISYFVQKKADPLKKKISQLQLYLQWGGIGIGIAAFCFCCCIACGRYQRHQVRKAMASNQYGGEATSLDRL